MDETLLRDQEGYYTLGQITALVEKAEKCGYPLEKGSYLESMTVKQLARLMDGRFDA